MNNKTGWTFVAAVSLILVASVVTDYKMNAVVFDKVKSGEYRLSCNLSEDRYTIVDKDKIVDRHDDVWIFTNGYSKTCTILKEQNNAITKPQEIEE